MLSYQHAYHAGGPADVHKHIALARMLAHLTRTPRGITYMETHAGRGLYDLNSPETRKTGEAAEGIDIADLQGEPFQQALADTKAAFGPTAYPGSPAVAAMMLRPQDEMHLMELHPAEHEALTRSLPGAHIERRDGYEGVMSLSPPTPRKGLILIDPSYEVKDEYAHVGKWVPRLMHKWPQATVIIWYPILRAARHEQMFDLLASQNPIRHEMAFNLKDGKGMTGSGLLIINAPEGFDAGPRALLS